MFLTIVILVSLTVAAAAFLLAPRLSESRLVFDVAPDHPLPFGYKMAWLALRTTDTWAVAAALDVGPATVANWNSGLGTVYDDKLGETHVFITPPVGGWTFVVGLPLPHPMTASFVDKCTPVLSDLAERFPEVQYFFSYPLIDYFSWARLIDGKLVRAFAINDQGVIWNRGRTTKEERSLGLKLFELRGVRGRSGDAGGELLLHPTEDHVLRLAHRWSIDPTTLGAAAAPAGTGLVATAPRAWRAERIRRSAA